MQKYVLSLILLVSFVAFSPDASAACLTLKRNLSIGSTGSDVAALQDFLYPVYMRYYAPSGRGTYGNFTKGAVMKFQMTFGISQTGTAGPATREKIRQISCGLSSSSAKPSTTNTNATNPAYNTTYNTTGTTNTSSVYCTKPPKLCSDGKTLVIGRGPACIYDACPSETLANSGTSMCANERLVCDNGSTVGRTGPNCAFAACPTSTNTTNSNGTKRCSDGSTVGQYEMCYQTCSNGVRILDTQSCSMFGSAVTTPNTNTGTMVCAQDVYMCSNGSYVTRSGSSCTFPQCPTGGTNTNIPATQYCTQEAFICPNGVGVFRTGPNCAFATCPTTTTTNGTFKPIDTGTNGQPITPTTNVSLTSTASAIGVEVPFTNLPNNAPLNKLFQTTIDIEKNSYIFRSFGLDQEQAVTYRVDIPEWFEGVQFRVQTNQNTEGMDVSRMITVSETRGDFDTTKVRTQTGSQITGNGCYVEGLHTTMEINTSKNGRSIYEYEDGGTLRNNISRTNFWPGQIEALKTATCIITPGKTYYINIRFTSPAGVTNFKSVDGCTAQRRLTGSVANCGTLVQIVHDGKIDVLKQLAANSSQTNTNSTTNTSSSGSFKAPDTALNGQTIRFENQQGTGNTFLNGEHGLAVSTAGSIATPPLSKLYETAFDFVYAAGYFQRARLTLKPNEAFTVRVDIPLSYDGGMGSIETNENTAGVLPISFISISETRGDFDVSKAYNPGTGGLASITGNPCYRSAKIAVLQYYISSTGEYPSRYENGASTAMSPQTAEFTKRSQCRLIPGKTYYFNLRAQDPINKPNEDSCTAYTPGQTNPVCGIIFRTTYSPPVPLNPVGTWNSLIGTNNTTPTTGPDIAIDGSIIPTISYLPAQIVPQRNNGDPNYNGMSTIINAYSVKDITPCNTSKRSTTAPITRLWQHNINLNDFVQRGNTQNYGIEPNEALAYKFTANFIGVVTIKTEDGSIGSSVPSFMSISSSPCDFDVTKLSATNRNYCYSSEGMPANGVTFRIVAKNTTPAPSSVCTLIEGNTYYMNLRSLDARVLDGREKLDACQARKEYMGFSTLKCGGIFMFR